MIKWQTLACCAVLIVRLVCPICLQDFPTIGSSTNKITFTSEIVNDDITMPYILYTPSNVKDEDVPLIVWLHGYNNGSLDRQIIESNGLPCALSQWELDGFKAYIVCPQLVGKWNYYPWFSEVTKSNVDDIVAKMISDYNIDTDRIIISGHSNGGMGAIYMASSNNKYYSKIVQISGCNVGIDTSPIQNISGRGYVGSTLYGEFRDNYYYTITTYANLVGEENIFVLPTGHTEAAIEAFLIDDDNNNESDLIEWMLE